MDSKICGRCKENKLLDFFSWKNRRLLIRHSVCKQCHVQYRRDHYLLHRSKYIEKARAWNGKQRKRLWKMIAEYLQSHSCVDCGEKDMIVLEFDHREGKLRGAADMVNRSYSVDKIWKEIDKCDVRCANCHRRKTAINRGFWKSVLRGK